METCDKDVDVTVVWKNKSFRYIFLNFIPLKKVYKKYHSQKKNPKIGCGFRVGKAKIYLHHSSKIAKARPYRVEIS